MKFSFSKSMIVIAVLAVVLSMSIVTVAWMSANRSLGSNGVEMNVTASPNLVISDSSQTIAAYSVSTFANSYVSKSWGDEDVTELVPSDHYDSSTYPSVGGSNPNTFNLVFNTNPENISRSLGTGNDLTFEHVPADGEGTYFIDKVVYIASLDKSMARGTDYTNITFTISETGTGTTTNRAYKSASTDVYVAGTYKGTLNLDTLNTFSVADLDSIPLNTSGSVEITFRCYFDGALQDASDNTKKYVTSNALTTNTADIRMNISIVAE